MTKQNLPTPNYQTPCSSGNPEDWFIGKDGRQFSDVDLVTDEAFDAYLHEIDPDDQMDDQEKDQARLQVEQVASKQALIRRRHAKEACHQQCYFRNKCLTQALDEGHVHGTWGGYHEEELREIRREKARRDRTDSSTEE